MRSPGAGRVQNVKRIVSIRVMLYKLRKEVHSALPFFVYFLLHVEALCAEIREENFAEANSPMRSHRYPEEGAQKE